MSVITFGTCSWNYDSWVGLVYDKTRSNATQYLADYAKKYTSVEVDSWFYKMPSRSDVEIYHDAVDPSFLFTCKVPQKISLTHLRSRSKQDPLIVNDSFLSADEFMYFYEQLKPIYKQTAAIMLEFEYLNKEKMPSLNAFLNRLEAFITKLPKGIPLALEPRNANYLKKEYFEFVKSHQLIHVLSEKQYMPSIVEVAEKFSDYFADTIVIRLLGGDRAEIEKITNEKWDQIVMSRPEKESIAKMVKSLSTRASHVIININNHYEGSAPRTIDAMRTLVEEC